MEEYDEVGVTSFSSSTENEEQVEISKSIMTMAL